MESSSLLTSLMTYLAVFMVLITLYTKLTTKHKHDCIFRPNLILKGLCYWQDYSYNERIVPRAWDPFAWIKDALHTTEADMIELSGLDTAVYLVFLSSVLGILVLSGLILLPMLLPVAAWTSSSSSTGNLKGVDKYSIGHVKAKSSRLWAFVIAVYWVSLVSYCVLWKACKHVSDLRALALRKANVEDRQFAILVRDIPPVPQHFENRKEQIDSYFRSIYPDTFYQSIVVTDNTKINKIWEELEGYKKELHRAQYLYLRSCDRPISRDGLFGLIGWKVDTISYLEDRIEKVEHRLEAEQKIILVEKQLSAALVFFNNRLDATTAAQSLHAQMGDNWTAMAAPEPCQIIWSNLALGYYERKIRQFAVYLMVALTILFYMIPLGFISALTTLANLENLLPFLKPIVEIKILRTVLEAYLPQLALIVFLAVLPKLLMFLSVLEGIPSTSHAVRATSGKFFYFTVFNAFVGVMIGGTVFSMYKTIEEDPHKTVGIFAENLSDNASVFLNYVALKFLVGYGLELSRLVPLIVFHLKRKFICKTMDDEKEAWAPGDLGYETRFPGDMLIATIVLCYSVIAPLILPFGIAYFGLGWLILKNQQWADVASHSYAFDRSFVVIPSGHPRVFRNEGILLTPVLVPLPIISLVFASVCKNKFYRYFECADLDAAAEPLHCDLDMEKVVQHFIPPGLRSIHEDEDEVENIYD